MIWWNCNVSLSFSFPKYYYHTLYLRLLLSHHSAMQVLVFRSLRLIFLLYYIISITFRLAFIPRFAIFTGFPTAIFFDYLPDLFFVLDYALFISKKRRVIPVLNSHLISSKSTKRAINRLLGRFKVEDEKVENDRPLSLFQHIEPYCQIIMVLPIEVIGYLAGDSNYYALRAIRLLRCVYFNQYWQKVSEMLEKQRIACTAGTQRIVLLALLMALVGHVFACIFYVMGLDALESGDLNNWVSADQLAVVDPNTGEITFLHPVSFRYLRAVYWSIQTVTSITFGDIVAHSQIETWFCILYFLVTAAIVYLSIANLTMVISKFDSARTENLKKIIRFEKYAAYRQLPPALTNRVVSYYHHQWERLRGVDEQKVVQI